MTRSLRAGPVALAVLLVAVVAGCGLQDAAESAADEAAQRAQDAARERVEEAVDGVTDEVRAQLEQEAQEALDRGFTELEQSAGTCAAYAGQAEDARRAQMGAILQAFWLAELVTTAPSGEDVGSYLADVDARCAGSPDAPVAVAAREAWDSGAHAPA